MDNTVPLRAAHQDQQPRSRFSTCEPLLSSQPYPPSTTKLAAGIIFTNLHLTLYSSHSNLRTLIYLMALNQDKDSSVSLHFITDLILKYCH